MRSQLHLRLEAAASRAPLTQRQLADAADVNETWISHIDARRTNPAWGTVARVAAALEVSVSELAARAERLADQ
jgi:transcriptional regulator with XRE-family HTH domain